MPPGLNWMNDHQHGVPRILLAASSVGIAVVKPLLPEPSKVELVHTVAQACEKLDERFDLILLGLFFDESRMFDLLGCIKHSDTNRDTPVLCFCPTEPQYASVLHESTSAALKLLGANGFVNLSSHSAMEIDTFIEDIREFTDRLSKH